MASEQDVVQLANLLSALTQPNTDAIRSAEAALKPILKNPACIPALVKVVEAGSNQTEAVRHTAVVLLRKRIVTHYGSFDGGVQGEFKGHLLNLLSCEGSRVMRHGIATVVAAVFKLEASETGGWLEVFGFLSSAASEQGLPEVRELAYYLLMETSETICGYYLKNQVATLVAMFDAGMKDGVHEVQVSAVKALGQFLSFLVNERELEELAPLLPLVIAVSRSCREKGDEETLSAILDVFYDLAYSNSKSVAMHLVSIVALSVECLTDGNLEMGVRDSAALVIATMAEAKPKRFAKEEAMVNGIVETLFQLIENTNDSAAGALFDSNPSWRDDDDDYHDEITQTSMAQGTLDMLACELPKKAIFHPVMSRSLARIASANPNSRKAGIASIGVIAEGCNEPIRQHLTDILPHVLKAASDQSPHVRECACFALGQLSEHCQPEILSYADQILPCVFVLLDDPIPTVQTTSCYVLEMFCERLEPSGVRPLLGPLVQKLTHLLHNSQKRSVQEMAVAALAATAVAAEEEFTPYVEGAATLMARFMTLTDEKMFSLRGRALECMGHMAIAVGKDTFRPFFSATMQCACEGLTFDSTDLHEFAYAVFANLAKVMGEEFAPVLNELVPHLIKVVDQEEAMLDKTAAENKAYNLDDSDDEDADNYVLQVRTPILEAKKGAITALGEMAAHTGAAYIPHLEETMRVLQKSAINWHPLIKTATAEALPSVINPTIAAYQNGEIKWEKGATAPPSPIAPQTTVVLNAVLKELLNLMKDDDKDTVGKACSSIQTIIETCGPHSLLPIAPECLENTHKLLTRQAPCCTHDEEDEEAYADELLFEDHDSFMTSVCDLVGAFPRVIGAEFAQYLPQFLPPIISFAKSSRPASDRSMSLGCLGEICQELGSAIAPHWPTMILPVVLAGMADPDDNVKRNSVFCAGVCCEGLTTIITDVYPQLLQSISPLFSLDPQKSDATSACVDNATAAICRMIMYNPTAVPLSEVIPVVLRSLPLKNDYTENETVYKCLLGLMSSNNAELAANIVELKRVFSEAAQDDSGVDDEWKQQIKAALSTLP